PLFEAYGRLTDPPPLILMGTRNTDTPSNFPSGVHVFYSVPHPTVMAAWDRSLFGVAPSILPEPLGNVVHEAMSRGKPVIGTYPGGMGDMIVDGESGLLVPAGDVTSLAGAMELLLGDPCLRDRLGSRAREHAARFTAAEVLPQIEQLYHDVLAQHRRAA
ncbi:MAG: glycosyltransferase, partial [Chloroflexota bacterium]